MDAEQFIKVARETFPFSYESEHFGHLRVEKGQVLAYERRIEIRKLNYLKVENDTLGFRMDRILDLESTNELLQISGTSSKDGLYYLDHESSLITVEELESDADAQAWIGEWLGISLEAYGALPPDERVQLFEKEVGITFITKTLEEFLAKMEVIPGESFGQR
ncbi:MAG: hypothetical protein R3B06_04465 [Kofleriaceae bacterium]